MLTVQEFNTTFSKSVDEHVLISSKLIEKNLFAKNLVDIYDTTSSEEVFTSTEGMKTATFRDESGNIQEADIGKGYRVTVEWQEYSIKVRLSSKALIQMQDDKTKLSTYIMEQAEEATRAMLRVQEHEGHRFFNQAFTTASTLNAFTLRSASIVCPDAEAVISNSHAYNSGATFDNYLTVGALTPAVLRSVDQAGANFTDAKGNPMPLKYRKIVVKMGSDTAHVAKQILNVRAVADQFETSTLTGSSGVVYETYEGWQIIESPYLTNANAYFFMIDYDSIDAPIKNPLFMSHEQRPTRLETTFDSDNGDIVVPYNGLLKLGVRNLPIGICGTTVS